MTVWPKLPEVIGHTGMFDYVEFVAEYSSCGLKDLENYARAVELFDMSCIIKPDQQNRGWVVQRAIGAGFQGGQLRRLPLGQIHTCTSACGIVRPN